MKSKKPFDIKTAKGNAEQDGGADSPFAAMQKLSEENLALEKRAQQYSPMHSPIGELKLPADKVLEAFDAIRSGNYGPLTREPKIVKGSTMFSLEEIAETTAPVDASRSLKLFDGFRQISEHQAAGLKPKP